MRKLKIIENPSEIAAGTRGASLGIDAIKIAAFNAKSKYFRDVEKVRIKDENNLLYGDEGSPHAKFIDGVIRVYERISREVATTLRIEKKFPLVLAGDHGSAGGTIAGIKLAYPDKRLGVVWIDAHADLHSPYTSPSGNIHGMPLATAIGEDNLDCKQNDVDPETIDKWEQLKNMAGVSPKVDPKDLVFICVRSAEDPEEHVISKHNIKDHLIEHIRDKGIKQVAKETLDHLKDCDMIYISFDVDCLDSSISEGTGTPVPNGLLEGEAADLITQLLVSDKLVCFEMVEVNPTLDNKRNTMAETAFRILDKATDIIRNKHVKGESRSFENRRARKG